MACAAQSLEDRRGWEAEHVNLRICWPTHNFSVNHPRIGRSSPGRVQRGEMKINYKAWQQYNGDGEWDVSCCARIHGHDPKVSLNSSVKHFPRGAGLRFYFWVVPSPIKKKSETGMAQQKPVFGEVHVSQDKIFPHSSVIVGSASASPKPKKGSFQEEH